MIDLNKRAIAKLKKRLGPVNASTGTIPAEPDHDRPDGRSLQRSERTTQLNLRVTPAFKQRLLEAAATNNIAMVEVLEAALALYEKDQT